MIMMLMMMTRVLAKLHKVSVIMNFFRLTLTVKPKLGLNFSLKLSLSGRVQF